MFKKSPLSNEVLKASPIKPRNRKAQKTDINLQTIEVKLADNKPCSFNFIELISNCTLNRKKAIINLANTIKEALKDKASVDTIYSKFKEFKIYVNYCDKKGIDPLSEKGFVDYCGYNGEIDRLVQLKKSPLPFIYLYNDGAELGINESTAISKKSGIRWCLEMSEAYQPSWDKYIPAGKGHSTPTKPYSECENKTALRRLQNVFFSTAEQLIDRKKEGQQLSECVVFLDNFESEQVRTVKLTSFNADKDQVSHFQPFNFAMMAGYYLFCHYTSFNMSSIIQVCHPISEYEVEKENRTTRYKQVKAWKSRANKIVDGVFSNDNDQFESTSIDIEKRGGLKFINTLIELSQLFNSKFADSTHPPLFYSLTLDGNPIGLNIGQGVTALHKTLALYSDRRSLHSDYLIGVFNQVLDSRTATVVMKGNDNIVKKNTVPLNKQSVKMWAIRVAFAVLRSITDIDLKNIYMPLTYSETDCEMTRVEFNYSDGRIGEFFINNRYVAFLQKLESYSLTYNPIKKSKYHPSFEPTPYLLPLGSKKKTQQWDGIDIDIYLYLKKLGIFIGDYSLELSSQKFRATAADLNFDPSDDGLNLSKNLLQNKPSTMEKHYVSGNVTQNQIIANQAIRIVEHYCKDKSLEEAKKRTKEDCKLEVLAYEEYKKLRMPTNPNGLLCQGGKPTGEAEKTHRASQRKAQSILNDEVQLTCYQYDKCIVCNSAKHVDDVQCTYKLLSFVDLLEESALQAAESSNAKTLNELANLFLYSAQVNLSEEVYAQAEEKLIEQGRYFLHNDDFLNSMVEIDYD